MGESTPWPTQLAGRRDSFFFSSRRRHTRLQGDWSSDVCSSDHDEEEANPTQARWNPFDDRERADRAQRRRAESNAALHRRRAEGLEMERAERHKRLVHERAQDARAAPEDGGA